MLYNMRSVVLLGSVSAVFFVFEVSADCIDINGRTIAPENHYVPGPDACLLCVCKEGEPKLCKAVLCAPPPDCQSFSRVGKSCCNFTCLDDASDFGLRLLVSAVAAVLSVSLLIFLVHRIRQRKTLGRRTHALRSEGHGLGSIGYITGSLGYLPENYFAGTDGFDRHIQFRYEEAPSQLSFWKPPSHASTYIPRGEAPPPYDEVVSQPRTELTITASSTLPNIAHRTIPLNLTTPGTIRIIHPGQRAAGERDLVTTLPHLPSKPRDTPTGTLQINISSCSFHGSHRQSEDAAVQSSGETNDASFVPALSNIAIGADALYADVPGFVTVGVSPCHQPMENSVGGLGGTTTHQQLLTSNDNADDNDDYRSECENCKSSPGGFYEPDDQDPPETMTLQRLPKEQEEEPFYRTSLTLPAHCRKPRSVLGSRENWFSSMPESSSEED